MKSNRRVSRFGFAVALTSLVSMGLASAQGCGGDDSVGENTDDASSDSAEDSPGTVGAVEVVATDVSAYVGTSGRIDASQSKRPSGSSLSFEWTIKSVPNGSTVTTASLVGASTEVPSLVVDVAGDFVLTGKATAGNESATKDVKITAVNAAVFYTQVNTKDSPLSTQIQTVQADGTGSHALNCRQNLFPDRFNQDAGEGGTGGLDIPDGQAGVLMIQGILSAVGGVFIDVALDSYEPPPGQPARAAFANLSSVGDASVMTLVAATTDNTCQNQALKLHTISAVGKDPTALQPRFSPDGQRIAYAEDRGQSDAGSTNVFIAVVGFDGSSYREISHYCSQPGQSCWGQHLFPRRAQWVDDAHISWVRSVDPKQKQPPFAWEIVTASDSPGSTAQRYMTCSTWDIPYSYSFLRNGDVVANYKPSQNAPEDLVVLGRDTGGNCTVLRNLTKFPAAAKGSFGRDFAVSPDQKLVAYVHHLEPISDAGTRDAFSNCPETGPCAPIAIVSSGGGILYSVPVEGTTPPAPVGGAQLAAVFGPRFVSGGTRLAWNGQAALPPGFDAGLTKEQIEAGAGASLAAGMSAINVIPLGGGPLVRVAVANLDDGTLPAGGGNGGACECRPECALRCDVAAKRRSDLALVTTSIIGLAFLARRRTRRK
jgi:WD40-like Beta Propeller Repeat